MSYILDALRKSEQERLRGQPLAGLVHAAAVPAAVRRNTAIGVLLAGNLLLAGAGLWWWSRAVPMNAPPAPTVARAAAADTPPRAARDSVRPPSTINAGAPVDLAADEMRIAPAPQRAAPSSGAPLVPGAIPSGFPPLRLSTHIYSSDPSSRTVVINGVRLGEGERLDNRVQVVEITEGGVRIDYAGRVALLKMQR